METQAKPLLLDMSKASYFSFPTPKDVRNTSQTRTYNAVMAQPNPHNTPAAMSIDVEDWFQVQNLAIDSSVVGFEGRQS